MTMAGEKTMSMIKKKGHGELMRIHLAVYPYEVQFLNNVDYPTAFYFEKSYQLIGQMKGLIPTGEKNTKLPLSDINNIIRFRLYSPNNVVYKWSVYRREDGQEQFLDSCTLNLKEAVTSFLGPQKSVGLGSHSSIMELGFINKEMRLKFPKMGAILSFMLYLAADTREISEHVQRHMIDHISEEAVPHTTLLRTDSGKLQQSSNAKVKNNGQSFYKIKSSDPIIGASSVEKLHSNSIEKGPPGPSQQEDKVKEEPAQNLENLIMSFDVNGNLNDPVKVHHPQTTKTPEPEEKLSDQIFKEDFPSSKPEEKAEEETPKEDKPSDGRDYGMLKLESDQGRIRQEMIDRKLELEELEAIEEEKPSRECTINETVFQGKIKKPKSGKSSTPDRSIKEEAEEAEMSTISKFNVKKIAVVFVLSIFLFVVAATLSKKIHKKKRVQRHRRDK